MRKQRHFFFSGLLLACGFFLSGCALRSSQPPATLYDLGTPSSMSTERMFPADMPALAVFRLDSSDWLNSTRMHFRLMHVNEQQTRFYTLSRWNTQPPKLFRDRFQSRVVAAGGEIGGGGIAGTNQLRLIIHMEDFSQRFFDDSNSKGRIALRISLLDKTGLVAQKYFSHAVTAPSPDAPGGAKALSVATDEVITEILRWIVENHDKGKAG